MAKVAVDKVGALVLIVLISPLLLVIGVVVALESRGGVLEKSRSVGAGGREFTLLRFRTTPATDARNDQQVTRIGGVLRQWNLHELPQLFNVLVGHMSLVGPSPALNAEANSRATGRSWVKPGLIGLGPAQMLPGDPAQRIHHYAQNWAPTDDLTILWGTARDVFRADQRL